MMTRNGYDFQECLEDGVIVECTVQFLNSLFLHLFVALFPKDYTSPSRIQAVQTSLVLVTTIDALRHFQSG